MEFSKARMARCAYTNCCSHFHLVHIDSLLAQQSIRVQLKTQVSPLVYGAKCAIDENLGMCIYRPCCVKRPRASKDLVLAPPIGVFGGDK